MKTSREKEGQNEGYREQRGRAGNTEERGEKREGTGEQRGKRNNGEKRWRLLRTVVQIHNTK